MGCAPRILNCLERGNVRLPTVLTGRGAFPAGTLSGVGSYGMALEAVDTRPPIRVHLREGGSSFRPAIGGSHQLLLILRMLQTEDIDGCGNSCHTPPSGVQAERAHAWQSAGSIQGVFARVVARGGLCPW